jgi:radical SAM superfamily enzyme YgiQ (UPF0313 family)
MIVLVNPNPMKPPVTPVSLDYLGSACNAAGIDVKLADYSAEPDFDRRLSDVLSEIPILVGVTVRNIDDSYFASRDFSLKRILPTLDKIKKLTDAPICLGGVGFSIFPKEVMEFCDVPYGIYGDGEESLVKLVRALEGKYNISEVPNLIWKENGIYQKNASKKIEISNMDLSSRSLINNRYYLENGGQVGFETKRGCFAKCTYCPEPYTKGRKVRLRNPLNVAKELTNLLNQGVNVFHTCDCEFNIPHTHAAEVSKAIISSGLGDKIKWYAYCSPEYFDDELASLMKSAGCAGIDFGADHGDDDLLKKLGHKYSSKDLVRIKQICRKYKFVFMYDLLLGTPGDTRKSIKKTIQLMKDIEPDRVGIGLGVRVYPNTEVGKMVINNGSLLKNPNLFGELENNESFLRPIYYCEAGLGEDIEDWLHEIIDNDPRFLLGRRTDADSNYNYNDNPVLSKAIKDGHRGAYWDILRQVSEG